MILEKVDKNKSLQFLSVNAFTYKIFFLGQKLRFWQGGIGSYSPRAFAAILEPASLGLTIKMDLKVIFHTRAEKIGVFLHIFDAEGTAKNF